MANPSTGAKSTPPSIGRFFIFNPRFGPREDNDHEKILMFYPSSTPLDSQQKDVGLSEALTNITKTFSKGAPCEVMHTKKSRWIFNNPEPGYWMVMILLNSTIAKPNGDIEYIENDLNDLALSTLLQKTYEQHRFFNGPFERVVVETGDVQKLRDLLEASFTKILPTLGSPSASIFGVLNGMSFLPCTPVPFMKVQSLVNTVEMNFPNVLQSVLLYKDHLVWSDLDQDDTKTLAQFWCETFWKRQKIPLETKYIYGVKDPSDLRSVIVAPTVFLGESAKPHNLVLIHGFGVACLFLINPDSAQDREFYKQLFDFISPLLKDTSSLLTKSLDNSETEEYLYIYFNSMNLAIKSTLKSKGVELNRETMNILMEMHENFVRTGDHQGEVMIKTAGDSWIIGKKSESRELYILFDQRNKPILEISDDVKQICHKVFKDVFSD